MKNLVSSVSYINNSKSRFLEHCNDMLRLIDPNGHASFESHKWVIPFSSNNTKVENWYATLYFEDFNNETLNFKSSIRIEFEVEEFINLKIIDFAKWLFLQQRHNNSLDYAGVWYLQMLKVLFAFLRENNIDSLDETKIEDFFSLALTHDFIDGTFVRRLSSPAYASRFKMFNLLSITRTLRLHGVEGVVPNIQEDDINKAFNTACLAQIDMTLADYKKGGTFDFLTLDVGKHYVDYCASFFEQHIVFATALRSAVIELGFDLVENGNQYKWDALFSENKEQLCNLIANKYNQIVVKYHAFNIYKLNQIISELKLDETRFDSYEFVRSLMYARFYDGQLKKREHILSEYAACINSDNAGFRIDFTLQDFDDYCDDALSEQILNLEKTKVLLDEYLDLFRDRTNAKMGSFFRDVEAAGVTALVAYTGWRASEYGFPESSLKSTVNKDISDAVYSPFRFYIKWISPKTNGETLLEREITLSTAILIRQLSVFTEENDNGFALTSAKFGDTTLIGSHVRGMVARHWVRFPEKYETFLDLDELELLTVKDTDGNLVELKRRQYLTDKYDLNSPVVEGLIELRDKLRKDNQVLQLIARSYKIGQKHLRVAETIRLYANGELDEIAVEILESRLSQETLEYIKINHVNISDSDTRAIIDEIKEGIFNATPHALRHVWAEAVLRRYKGDIGKFIRANFKHIDDRFFMAYLKGKEAKAIMQVAKRTTINHIVRSRIQSINEERRHYAGMFDRFINKAVAITKVNTLEEYEKLANMVSNNRIIDIKVNPWNTCVLRKGTFANAKCSEGGIPQRHKAEPKFCLGCINGDFEEGNYNGTVVYVKPDVEACRNPNLPMFIKRSHLVTVRLALKRIQELGKNYDESPYQKYIDFLNETIEMAVSSEEVS
ncbi:hypothetical protein [Thalassotalea hakodatensis]|uniref:hypothetical protein n=1 Tax=Thalassotalea hakodatensis TaxID=3030492 RepID=UPI0025744AF3|nr:hypothetical protein [Thalassotalea hakodatensis]